MHIDVFPLGFTATNCYVLKDDETKTAAIIDPGQDAEKLLSHLTGYEVTHLLLTHTHFDHIAGLEGLKQATGAPIFVSAAEANCLSDPHRNLSTLFGDVVPPVYAPDADVLLKDGDHVTVGKTTLLAVATPGHSPGHLSFLSGDICIAGDALFAGSIGRTDIPGGNHDQLIQSIRAKLLVLPDNTRVLPGHGEETTIGKEKRMNPFLTHLA